MPDAPLPPLPPVGQPRWRTAAFDLLARLPRPHRRPGPLAAGLAGAVVAGLVVGGILLLRPPAPVARAELPRATPAPPEPAEPDPPGARRPQPEGEVVVDVAGAVGRPGLVRLIAGARVADALAAAGGPSADAALAGVNQARVLADGEQVRVPRVGEPAPAPPPPAASGAGSAAPADPVDLNRATPADLDALPGVGPATASAIVTWRDENGGFHRVDDLLEVPGIGPAKLERLRPHVRV